MKCMVVRISDSYVICFDRGTLGFVVFILWLYCFGLGLMGIVFLKSLYRGVGGSQLRLFAYGGIGIPFFLNCSVRALQWRIWHG